MTLDALLEELNALPKVARSAIVLICKDDLDDFDISSVCYQSGQVIIAIEGDEDDDD